MSNRRTFFHSCLRFVGAGGLFSFAAGQKWKERRLRLDPNCLRANPCDECPKLRACTKTQLRPLA